MIRHRTLGIRLVRPWALLGVLALIFASCGGDDSSQTQATTAAPAATVASDTTAAPETTKATTAAPAATVASDTTAAPETTKATTAAPAATVASDTTEAMAEPTDIRLRLSWVADNAFMGVYEAIEQGYFEEENLNVSIEHGGPNTPNAGQIVAGGAADIGVTDLNALILGNSEGGDFVAFGVRLQQDPGGIGSLCDNPINSPADIAGKTIGGGGPGDSFRIDSLLKVNGLEPGSYDFVPVGFDVTPLAEGQVDGMLVWVTWHTLLLTAQGICNVSWTFGEFGMPVYQDIFFTTREFLDENRDAIVGFLRANVRGWSYAMGNPAHGIDLVMDVWGGEALGLVWEEQMAAYEAQLPLMASDLTDEKGLFWFDLDLIEERMYPNALLVTGLDELPPVDVVFDISILQDVYGTCGPNLLDC